MRRKVVALAGIMSINSDMNAVTTREQFAKMTVCASSYKNVLSTVSSVSVFSDVPSSSEYASAIKICAENNYMSAFLGGNFRPAQGVTLNEAARATLGLLGYTNEDFAGDVLNKRIAKFNSLSLSENISKKPQDALTNEDCVNLFYNLLRCETKTGKTYASTIGASLTATGEVDALSMADSTLKGPKIIKTKAALKDYIPFSLDDASFYENGEPSTQASFISFLSEQTVVYYNSTSKTIWGYDTSGSGSSKRVAQGTIETIVYKSDNTLTPSGVVIDGATYTLSSADMQFAFSVYGTCRVGENITVIYTPASDPSSSGSVGTIIDYIY